MTDKREVHTYLKIDFKQETDGSITMCQPHLADKILLPIGLKEECKMHDTPAITNVVYPLSIDIPSFSDYNIEYDVTYQSFGTSFVKVELLKKHSIFVVKS